EVSASPVQWKGRPAALLFLRDVPERERVLDALRLSADRDRQLFEKSPQPMWVHDVDSLRFLAGNDAALRAYGYAREQMLAMRVTDLFVSSDVPVDEAEQRPLDAAWAAQVQRHRTKRGDVRDVEVASHEIQHEGQRARLVAVTDVTRRRAAQQRL